MPRRRSSARRGTLAADREAAPKNPFRSRSTSPNSSGDAIQLDLGGEGGAAGLMNGYRLSVHAGPTAPPSPLPPQANGEIGNDHHEDNPEAHAS